MSLRRRRTALSALPCRKRSNKTECAFYRELTLTNPELAPEFCGVHLSDGNAWTSYVVLEDLTVGFSKPQILDVQIGPEHVGSGNAGDAAKVGLRMNGMQVRSHLCYVSLCIVECCLSVVVLELAQCGGCGSAGLIAGK